MKVLHLFCGLGGGALGFKRAGFECWARAEQWVQPEEEART